MPAGSSDRAGRSNASDAFLRFLRGSWRPGQDQRLARQAEQYTDSDDQEEFGASSNNHVRTAPAGSELVLGSSVVVDQSIGPRFCWKALAGGWDQLPPRVGRPKDFDIEIKISPVLFASKPLAMATMAAATRMDDQIRSPRRSRQRSPDCAEGSHRKQRRARRPAGEYRAVRACGSAIVLDISASSRSDHVQKICSESSARQHGRQRAGRRQTTGVFHRRQL